MGVKELFLKGVKGFFGKNEEISRQYHLIFKFQERTAGDIVETEFFFC